eukprot:787340-Rhodomonas_salina.3
MSGTDPTLAATACPVLAYASCYGMSGTDVWYVRTAGGRQAERPPRTPPLRRRTYAGVVFGCRAQAVLAECTQSAHRVHTECTQHDCASSVLSFFFSSGNACAARRRVSSQCASCTSALSL